MGQQKHIINSLRLQEVDYMRESKNEEELEEPKLGPIIQKAQLNHLLYL